MRDYVLAGLAGLWLADGAALLVAPRWTIDRLREALHHSTAILRWEVFSIIAGFALLVMSLDLRYQPLWTIAGLGMILKGFFLWLGPKQLRQSALDWCLVREEVDYRFWGLALCALAVLLLRTLGWIGPP